MNWQEELRYNLVDPVELFPDEADLDALRRVTREYPMSVTRYYASLIDKNDPNDPIRRMCVPSAAELVCGGTADTSGERSNTKSTGVQHKYGPTALILSTNVCATYCRHCFRKRMTGVSGAEIARTLDEAVAYIRSHEEITNVLITGGDALLNSNEVLEEYLRRLSEIDRLTMIRFGSRVPVVFPMRISEDPALLSLLSAYSGKKKLYVSTQFNHPRELTGQARAAIDALRDANVAVHNQTVLLRGVNDSADTLAALMRGLTGMGVTPYYLFQCRPTAGVKTLFQVPLCEAYDIVEAAKAQLSGYSKRFRYVMSHVTGKIEILGKTGDGQMVFKYHQAKDARDHGRLFLAPVSETDCWLPY